MNIIPEKDLKTICKLGEGTACCKYLLNGGNWMCAKGTQVQQVIDLKSDKRIMWLFLE